MKREDVEEEDVEEEEEDTEDQESLEESLAVSSEQDVEEEEEEDSPEVEVREEEEEEVHRLQRAKQPTTHKQVFIDPYKSDPFHALPHQRSHIHAAAVVVCLV